MISAACRDLLIDSQRFSAAYGGGLSNHLPMALLALDRLGADDARLRGFAASYAKRLRPKSASSALPEGDWHAALGNPQYEAALAETFARDLRERSVEALLREVVPQLRPGLASEAFHGLIRLAYAVDSGEDADVPDALTSWVIGFSALPAGSEAQRFTTFADALDAIAADPHLPRTLDGRSISGRIARVASLPAFQDYCGGIRHVELADIATACARVFVATGDFTALHMVTGCHATRVLLPFLGPQTLEILATAILAAYVTIGRPPIPDLGAALAGDLPDDLTLAARAIPSDDEHDLKLVYSCLREEAEYGTRFHRLAAAVRLGLGAR